MIGLLLLINVVTVAILGTPRIRYFGDAHLNTWVTYTPFVWLPAVMVLAALAGHLIVFQALRSRGRGFSPGIRIHRTPAPSSPPSPRMPGLKPRPTGTVPGRRKPAPTFSGPHISRRLPGGAHELVGRHQHGPLQPLRQLRVAGEKPSTAAAASGLRCPDSVASVHRVGKKISPVR